jgi:hypothetical protein
LGFLVSGKKVLAFWGLSSAQMGRRGMSLFWGFLFPEKRFWRFGDCLRRKWGAAACPFFGVSCFRKKGFGVLGTVFGANGAPRHVLFLGFLVSGKQGWPISEGHTQSLSEPSSGSSSSSESKLIHEA